MAIVAVGFIVNLLLTFAVSWRVKESSGSCPADAEEPWSYSGRNGPAYWGKRYLTCNGKEQSPIDINSASVVQDPNLGKLELKNYEVPVTKARIENDGRTVNIVPEDGVRRTIVVKNSIYTLSLFHFHWGDTSYKGAEHQINGKRSSMELHFVHRNEKNQVAVVGVFYQEERRDNSYIQKIVDALHQVQYRNMTGQIRSSINLNDLLPSNPASFYRYQGSLTTPACDEGVTWSVLKKIMKIGKSQISEFRKLYSTVEKKANSKCRLSNNYRPTQSINGRKVYSSK